jgi:hypothetical protein
MIRWPDRSAGSRCTVQLSHVAGALIGEEGEAVASGGLAFCCGC